MSYRSSQEPTPGERFTAVVTAMGAVLLPLTALASDSLLPLGQYKADAAQHVAPPKPPSKPDPRVGADGRMPVDSALSPKFFADLNEPEKLSTGAGPLAQIPPGRLGIPAAMLDAYLRAERQAAARPGFGPHWSVIAAIGRVESNHARDGQVDAAGTTVSPILGPQLSGGPGVAAIRDTDGGRFDGDRVWDRAVGPMQFIPSTWQRYAVDGNGDHIVSPHNAGDAALAAANYLSAAGTNLRDRAELARAIFRYNPSEAYVRTVLVWADRYASGVIPLPPGTPPGDIAPPELVNSIPPVYGLPGSVAPVAAAGPAPAPPPPADAPAPPPPAPEPAPAPAPAPPPPPPPQSSPPPPPPPSSSAPPPPPPSSSQPPPPPPSSSEPPPPPPPSSSAPPPPAPSSTSPTPNSTSSNTAR